MMEASGDVEVLLMADVLIDYPRTRTLSLGEMRFGPSRDMPLEEALEI